MIFYTVLLCFLSLTQCTLLNGSSVEHMVKERTAIILELILNVFPRLNMTALAGLCLLLR